MLATKTKIDTSLDGHGYTVRIGDSHWRFSRYEFAEQFANRMGDELFSAEIISHAHGHDWERCEPVSCRGSLWQIIQGLE